jgi:hypothetical protein
MVGFVTTSVPAVAASPTVPAMSDLAVDAVSGAGRDTDVVGYPERYPDATRPSTLANEDERWRPGPAE